MKPLFDFYRSSIGKKLIVAVTGLALIVFVIGHLLGNLQIFIGRHQLNIYAHHLQSLGPLLWVIRLGLATVVGLHVVCALQLAAMNRAARGREPYGVNATVRATLVSRTMVISGLILLAFLVYHILHFTVGATHPQIMTHRDELGHRDVYSMVILGFRDPVVASLYLVAMAMLCAHLSHAASSAMQTFGIGTERRWPLLRPGAWALGLLLFLGNAAIVLSCLLGFLKLPWEKLS